MEEHYSIQKLLLLRKLTRGIADLLRNQLKSFLSTLSPLLRPRRVLGDYVEGSTKESVRGADVVFKELQTLFETIVGAKPFSLSKDLKAPLEIVSSALEIHPVEYLHEAKTEQESKSIHVTSPLKWVLTYSGFAPGRLKELLADPNRAANELREFVLHTLAMHLVVSKQTGIAQIFEALHFPISTDRCPEFGSLPFTCISASVSTLLPPDDVIIESTEISGTPAFEEIVNLGSIVQMPNPFKDQLVELVKKHGEELLPV